MTLYDATDGVTMTVQDRRQDSEMKKSYAKFGAASHTLGH
jgi:hypothetical protein